MNLIGISDAAKAYADTLYPQSLPNAKWQVATEAFDAGAASVAQPTPRTLSTAAELDALPVGSVVIDRDDDVWRKTTSRAWMCYGAVDNAPASRVLAFFPLTLLAAAPEPTRLTDPEDPRIRVGALVERTHASGNGESVTYRHRVDTNSAAWGVAAVRKACTHTPTLLIEEAAPDPDAARLSAVVEWLGNHGITTSNSRDLLTLLDSVVKRADA